MSGGGWTHIESSNIHRVLYFRNTSLLVIEFKSGAMYVYFEVPWSVYLKFRRAESHGSYFSNHIKDVYDYQPIDETDITRLGLDR